MSRVEDVTKFILAQPKHFEGTEDECLVQVEVAKLNVLWDIDLSLAYIVDILNHKDIKEEKPKEKKPLEKTCETCIYDLNYKGDTPMACDHCYEYSEWEGFEC